MVRRPVVPPVDPGDLSRVALRGRTVAWATQQGVVHLTDVDGGVLGHVEEEAEALRWSPSGEHLLLERSGRSRVWQPAAGRIVAEVEDTTAALMSDHRGDALVTVAEPGLVRGLRLPGLGPVIELDLRRCGYTVGRVRQLAGPGSGLVIVGHPWDELADWLLLFPPEVLQEQFAPFTTDRDCYVSPFVADRGAPVLGGHAGRHDVVVYRDHDGAEDPEDADDVDQFAEVWGFRGFYLRRVADPAPVQRLPYTPGTPPSGGAEVFATPAVVALADGGSLHVLSRGDGELLALVSARLLAPDPVAGRVLTVGADGRVELLTLDRRG